MKRIVSGILLIAAVAYIVHQGQPFPLATVQLIFTIAGLWEFFRLVDSAHFRPLRWQGYLAAVLLSLNNALFSRAHADATGTGYASMALDPGPAGMLSIFSIVLAVMMGAALRSSRNVSDYIGSVAVSYLGCAYVALPLALLVFVGLQADGPFYLLFALVVIWVGDTAAYYFGKNFGRHKSSPTISPNKTWEGTIASFVAALLAGLITARYVWGGGYVEITLLAGALNIAGQLGDLAESALKRGAGVKDSSGLIPGHGGVLDRIDSLLFAAPVLWYYWLLYAG
jgi:phosphatidate cytidylyltransferase